MADSSFPNQDLADLARVLGDENVRTLVRTFLREYPSLLRVLSQGDRNSRHRTAHSLKSNARVIGARTLSARMAEIETRLSNTAEPDLTPAELMAVVAEFETVAGELRRFVGEP